MESSSSSPPKIPDSPIPASQSGSSIQLDSLIPASQSGSSLQLDSLIPASQSGSSLQLDSLIPASQSGSSLQLDSLSSALPSPSPSLLPRFYDSSIRYLEIKDSDVGSDETLWGLYERWITHAQVSRSIEEKQKRFPSFKKNAKYIHSENKTDNFPYELELNKYSDMTPEEFESTCATVNFGNFKHLDIKDSDLKSDKSLQRLYKLWMTRYRVSRSPSEKLERFAVFKENVKYIHSENKKDNIYKLGLNRFSDMTTEEFEGPRMRASPAQLLQFYDKIVKSGGILSKDDYNQGRTDGPKMELDGYRLIPPNDEEALIEAAAKSPMICAFVDARGDAFKNYRGGVLTVESGKELVFTVNITGFGITPYGVRFWEIQNCWGPLWGEGGYIRIKAGVNLCGIASFASEPIINEQSFLAYCKRR